ncbi:MAG: hypothetical protein IJ212_05335 [Bacteroidaceae bacterium]|nr:hypothetical protein [Bacteroidaceae bacterium]
MKKILYFLACLGLTMSLSSCFGPEFWDDGPRHHHHHHHHPHYEMHHHGGPGHYGRY